MIDWERLKELTLTLGEQYKENRAGVLSFQSSERDEGIQLIQGVLNQIEELVAAGYNTHFVKGGFSNAIKRSILTGCYLSVLNKIRLSYEGRLSKAMFSEDYTKRSVLARTIMEIFDGEEVIRHNEHRRINNYRLFKDNIYPDYNRDIVEAKL